MSNRGLGLILMGTGGLLTLIGLVAWATSEGGSTKAVATTTTVPPTIPAEPSTTVPPTTTSTTSAPTTTSTTIPATTTTTIDADVEIAQFVEAFADAISQEDTDFLFATLHPAVIELFDSLSCRTFISDEILQLEQYRLIGEATGPERSQVADSIVEMYTAPVAFTFQDQEFTSDAAFAFMGPDVRWFTQCGE